MSSSTASADSPEPQPYGQITVVIDDSPADTAIQAATKHTFTPLARAIYNSLRLRVPGPRDRALITYRQIVEKLPAQFADVGPHDTRLFAALGEIVEVCKCRKLPVLTAIVVRHDERIPGDGYFQAAHPDVADDEAAHLVAWESELQEVLKSTYRELV